LPFIKSVSVFLFASYATLLKKDAKGLNMSEQERLLMLVDMIKEKYGNRLLNRDEAAAALGKSTASLDKLRAQGLGPSYIKAGACNAQVKYSILDVAEYILSMRIMTVN
jgi:hypothetical protein